MLFAQMPARRGSGVCKLWSVWRIRIATIVNRHSRIASALPCAFCQLSPVSFYTEALYFVQPNY